MLLPLRVVETQELTENTASVTISSINTKVPSGSRHLYLLVEGSVNTGGIQGVRIQFNGDTGSNYNNQFCRGAGAGASAAIGTGETYGRIGLTNSTASLRFVSETVIPHFANTVGHKSFVSISGFSEAETSSHVCRWANTAAITSLVVLPEGQLLIAGTRVVLCVVDERYLIAETILSGSDGTFTFPTLPAVEGDLAVIGYLRSDRSAGAAQDGVKWEINADTTSGNYARQLLSGVGASVTSGSASDNRLGGDGQISDENCTSGSFAALVSTISQYNRGADDPHCVTIVGFHSTSTLNSGVDVAIARRNNVAAVTRVDYKPQNGTNFKDGSMMGIYSVPRRLLQRQVMTGDAASVTFSSLPSNVEALIVRVYARVDGGVTSDPIDFEFNDDTTAANYDRQMIEGDGGSVAVTQSAASQTQFEVPGDSAGADIFGGGTLTIPMHDKTDRHKVVMSMGGPAEDVIQLICSRWENNAAITKIVLSPNGGSNFMAGSVFELYAIEADGHDVSDRTRITKAMVTP